MSPLDLPVSESVATRSMVFWMRRPAMRQKRKRGRTERRWDCSTNEPAGKTSSMSTKGKRSM